MSKIGYIRVSTEHQETARQQEIMCDYQARRLKRKSPQKRLQRVSESLRLFVSIEFVPVVVCSTMPDRTYAERKTGAPISYTMWNVIYITRNQHTNVVFIGFYDHNC